MTDRDVADIRSLLYRMTGSYGAKDVDGVLETFIEGEPTIIGTGRDEVRFGVEEVRAQIIRDTSEPDSLSSSLDDLRISVFDNAAFAFSNVWIHASFGDQHLRFPVRMTFGLVRTDDGWRIAQIHTSAAEKDQPEGRSFAVPLTKTLSDLLTSIDTADAADALNSIAMGTTTFLFTDIVDSTSLSQSMGDRRWSALITKHFESVQSIVESLGGTVVKTLGDGGMFAFTSGTSALLTAIRTQRAMVAITDHPLMIRVGVHTGDVVRDRDDYIGLTVSKAARVAAAAQGGQVLVSATTADVVNSSDIRFGEPMTVELKGLGGSHMLFPLEWAATT